MSQFRFKVGNKVLIAQEGKNRFSLAKILRIGALAHEGKRVKTPSSRPKLVPVNRGTRKEDLRYHIRYNGRYSWNDEVVETHRVLKKPVGANRKLKRRRASQRTYQVLEDGETSIDEGDPEVPYNHEDEFAANGQEIGVSGVQSMGQDVEEGEGETETHGGEDASSSSPGGSTANSSLRAKTSGSQDGRPEVANDLSSRDDDEVVILSTIDLNNKSGMKVKDDKGFYFDYKKDVPLVLRELLVQDGRDTKRGDSQLCTKWIHGWSANKALSEFIQSCKAQGDPDLVDIKRYVIKFRARMFEAIAGNSIFLRQELDAIRKVRGLALHIDTDILDLLPVIYILRLFYKGNVPRDVPKELQHAFLRFLTENANACFPYQMQAMMAEEILLWTSTLD